jgi:hypothetical protein
VASIRHEIVIAVRFLTFPDGHIVRELIASIDDDALRLAYSVIEGARPLIQPCRMCTAMCAACSRAASARNWRTSAIRDLAQSWHQYQRAHAHEHNA